MPLARVGGPGLTAEVDMPSARVKEWTCPSDWCVDVPGLGTEVDMPSSGGEDWT